jgi:hypothetical protein
MTAFGEKRGTLMGLAGMHSATYYVFLNMCTHTETHTHTSAAHTPCACYQLAAVCTPTTLDSQYQGEHDKESTVNHLVRRKQIHRNNAERSAICTDKIFLSAERFNTGLTIFTFAPCMLLHSLYLKPTHALL